MQKKLNNFKKIPLSAIVLVLSVQGCANQEKKPVNPPVQPVAKVEQQPAPQPVKPRRRRSLNSMLWIVLNR